MNASLGRDWNRTLIRWSVYSLATIMDIVLSGLIFVCTERAVEMTGSSAASGGMLAVWAAMYSLWSVIIGRKVTRRNVGGLLLGSCGLVIVLSLAFLMWPGLVAMYVIIGLQGVASAMFFPPFQVFMKLVDEGQQKGLARSSGLYVASWSLGYALGPFIVGILWRYGWEVCHVFNIGLVVVMTAGVIGLRRYANVQPVVEVSPAAAGALKPTNGRSAHGGGGTRMPDLVWMAWVFSGVGCMLTSMIRTHFPAAGSFYHLSPFSQGITLCIMSAVQAVIGFLLGYGRNWMYRPASLLAFGIFGVIGLVLFACAQSVSVYWVAAASMGVYAGCFYVYFVYHALVHPTRGPLYVSINEAVVGVGGVIGPYLGGMLADRAGLGVPFAVGAVLVGVGICVQAGVHHWHNRRLAAPSIPRRGGYDTPHERDQNQARVGCGV